MFWNGIEQYEKEGAVIFFQNKSLDLEKKLFQKLYDEFADRKLHPLWIGDKPMSVFDYL